MAKKRKLYYAPGLISLIGISIFIIANKSKFVSTQDAVLTLSFPKDKKPENFLRFKEFSSFWIEYEAKKKKQIIITLDSDRITNQKKIDLIKYEARKLKYTLDTTTVIRVNFTDESTYGEFVQLVDICYADKHKRFVPLKKSFIIFGEYPAVKMGKELSIPIFGSDIIKILNIPEKVNFLKRIKNKLIPFMNKRDITLIVGWLFLVYVSIYSSRKKRLKFSTY